MSSRSFRLRVLAGVLALLGAATMSGVGRLAPASAASPSPDVAPAAAWLAGLVGPDGSVENPYDPGVASVAWTVNVALSLVSAGTEPEALAAALGYIDGSVDDYVVVGGDDNAGRLGYLIMLAVATGADPSSYGTPSTDLVARLLALYGTDEDGLFGPPDAFSAATNQSLAVLGLVAAGATPPSGALDWLVAQQCVGGATPALSLGGWQPYRAPSGAGLEDCVAPDPASFAGPDTNTSAFVVQALAAAGASAPVPAALDFLRGAQDLADPYKGGFANYPGTPADPNSTALVIQALVAAGENLDDWAVDGATVLGSLQVWVIGTGPDAGALSSPFSFGAADPFATYQGVWGLALTPFPFTAPGGPVVPDPPATNPDPSAPTSTDPATPVVVTAAFTG
jgi:hypothetical protein